MSKEHDDGPAFARSGDGCVPQVGLSVRDYFAAAALTGLLAWSSEPNTAQYDPKTATELAYEMADAMLKARKQNQG